MGKKTGMDTETDRRSDTHDKPATERIPPAEKGEKGAGGIAKQAYEEVIDKAVEDVHD